MPRQPPGKDVMNALQIVGLVILGYVGFVVLSDLTRWVGARLAGTATSV